MFRMAVPVFTRLEGRIPISRHDHVAVLYRGRDAAFRLASFLAEGLERGESCHYLAPRAFHAGMIDEVKKHAGNLDRFFAARNLPPGVYVVMHNQAFPVSRVRKDRENARFVPID